MSIYYCFECDEQKDNDHEFCHEHPLTGELVCEECIVKLSYAMPDLFDTIAYELGEKQGGRNERVC